MFEERKWVGRYGTVVYSSRSAWRKVGRRRTYSMPGSLHGGWGPLDKWAGEPPFGQGVEGELFAVLPLRTLRWGQRTVGG